MRRVVYLGDVGSGLAWYVELETGWPGRALEPQWVEGPRVVKEAAEATAERSITQENNPGQWKPGFSLSDKGNANMERENQDGHCSADWNWSYHLNSVL